jgi:hypothetical protein
MQRRGCSLGVRRGYMDNMADHTDPRIVARLDVGAEASAAPAWRDPCALGPAHLPLCPVSSLVCPLRLTVWDEAIPATTSRWPTYGRIAVD